MTEPEQVLRTPQQQMAKQLARELGGHEPFPGHDIDLSEHLSAVGKLLVNDAFGLCQGMSNGTIITGQPRLMENLMRIAVEVSEEPDSPQRHQIIGALCEVVSRAAGAGLTAENTSLTRIAKHISR